jgi:hypothetical protein
MQQQVPSTGTWRIGFDLAAFVMLATIAGMAAAVTLASIALLLTSVVSSTPGSGAPLSIPNSPASQTTPPAVPRTQSADPAAPAGAPVDPARLRGAPAAIPTTPPTDVDAPEPPGLAPVLQTQLARVAAPAL